MTQFAPQRASAVAPGHVDPWTAIPARVMDVTPEIADVATYAIQLRGGSAAAGYACQPGQFNMLYVPGVGEAAISVSGYDAQRDLWLHTIRTAGAVTGMLERGGVGASLLVRGAFGAAWPIAQCAGHDVVVVAGGIGLAPLRPAIERLLDPAAGARRVTLIYGARTADSRLYVRQFDDWQARGLHVECIVDRAAPNWRGHIGVATLLVDRLEPWLPQNTVLLTCGPEVMMRYVLRSALARGLQPPQIWLSLERNMQCAARLCGHCQLGPAFVCQDGPVFRLDQIAPYLDVEQL